ncbi:MAG TPA: histidine phosphatase family protein [Steroidobacteraceae bacterium]|nr:histidine phosphatase family protein [Steroidobacteraceae bacterium]
MKRRVLLVRHTEVAVRWSRRCYGCSDVGLSRAGRLHAMELAAKLAMQSVTALVHSGLERAAYLARRIAEMKKLTPIADARWRERNFGTWEGRGWHSIWKETGSAMDRLLDEPAVYRPGGGETTLELAERSAAAWAALPAEGVIVVVSHGGPIAAVRTLLARAALTDILSYRVGTGAVIALDR